MNIPRLIRTVIRLRPIQIWNRIWRKRPIATPHIEPQSARDVRPKIPFPPYEVKWDGERTFTFLNQSSTLAFPASWNTPSLPKLWLYNLHYLDALRSSQDFAQKQSLLTSWICDNSHKSGNGWEPYPISLRVVNIIKFLLTYPISATLRAQFEASLTAQIAHLEKRLEYHLLANHLLANAKALVFAGRYFSGPIAERWYNCGMRIYKRELPEQILPDGLHFELSPMYHSIILEDILDLCNYTSEPIFQKYAEKMLPALRNLTGPDGKIALFSDAASGMALPPQTLFAYAKALSIKEIYIPLSSSGYVRIEASPYTLIAKAGDIGPSYQPGHAHADSLTFELWRGSEKIVTDTGTDHYAFDAARHYQRSSIAHNVPVLDNENSSEVWSSHRVGKRAKTSIISASENSLKAKLITASGAIITRSLTLTQNGLSGEDYIDGKGVHDIAIYFHSPLNAAPRITIQGQSTQIAPCEIAEEFGKTATGKCTYFCSKQNLPIAIKWNVC